MRSLQSDDSKDSILIVDDVLSNLQVLSTMLTEHGYAVRGAANGAAALMMINARPPDLILLDIRMPEMDGYQVCQQLRATEKTRDIPVIFISALDELADKVQGFAVGGVDYITKPFQVEEVLARVQTHLALRNLQTQREAQNAQLEQEIAERKQAEAALQHARDELEQRVAERTAELTETVTQVKRLNEKLERERARAQQYLDVARVAFIALDSDGHVTLINKRGLELFGYEEAELIGKNWFEICLSQGWRERVQGVFEQLTAGEIEPVESHENPILTKSGAERIVAWHNALLRDAAGNIVGTLSSGEDITERVQAEQALRASEERFRNLSEAAKEGIAIHDYGVIVEANEAFARMFGYELSEVVGMHAERFVSPQSWETVLKHITTGYDKLYRAIGVKKDGSTFDCEMVGRPYQYRGKTLRVAVVRDITERVQAEEMLKRRNRELALLNRVIAASTSTLDVEQVLQIACQELAYAFDLPQATAVSLNAEKNQATTVAEYLAPGRPSGLGETLFAPGDPVARHILEHKMPLAVTDAQTDERLAGFHDLVRQRGIVSLLTVPILVRGEIAGGIRLDAAERREFSDEEITLAQNVAAAAGRALETAQLYQELQSRAAELARALAQRQELDRLRSEFIRNVSHELRTPLALIQGHAELLEAEVLGELQPDQQGSVAVIARRTRMLTDIMDDFAAVIDAETELQRRPVDLAALVQGALADLQARVTAEKVGLTLQVQVAPDLPQVSGDAIQLRRVVNNLLDNALKFTSASGHVAVRLWQGGTDLVLEVSDTGIGIPADQLERVFERFYQIDGSPTRRYGGTGLGLALVKEIVEVHGGQVSVQSTVGQG
ncbi:MAG: PAS domain S-box protein, partial [Anaerolineae bacterium]